MGETCEIPQGVQLLSTFGAIAVIVVLGYLLFAITRAISR